MNSANASCNFPVRVPTCADAFLNFTALTCAGAMFNFVSGFQNRTGASFNSAAGAPICARGSLNFCFGVPTCADASYNPEGTHYSTSCTSVTLGAVLYVCSRCSTLGLLVSDSSHHVCVWVSVARSGNTAFEQHCVLLLLPRLLSSQGRFKRCPGLGDMFVHAVPCKAGCPCRCPCATPRLMCMSIWEFRTPGPAETSGYNRSPC